jgi:hypothetical protein
VYVWSAPTGCGTAPEDGSWNLARFEPPSPHAPLVVEIEGAYVHRLARRSVPGSPADPMRIERTGTYGGFEERYRFDELEAMVERPEPREFAGGDRAPLLAWVAHRDFGSGPEPVGRYVPPLEPGGAPAGPSARIDDAGDSRAPAPEFIRVISDGGAIYAIWRCASDLCVAALAQSS